MIRKHTSSGSVEGFTLIEIMVVVVILGILALYVAPKFIGRTEEAKVTRVRLDFQALETALKLYRLDNGVYPTTDQGLTALVQPPDIEPIPKRWRSDGYMDKGRIPQDPWGNPYIYISPGAQGDFDIISLGADGLEGGEAENQDLTNWDAP